MKRHILSCLSALFLLLLSTYAIYAQEQTVSGTVTSAEDGSGLPGVNVVVKGSATGTVTDVDGKFSLNAPQNGTLVFTFIGLATQEVPINGQTNITVQMAQDVQQLSEVVVTGLNIPREQASLGYAVAQVKGDQLAQVNQTNVVNSLSGRVAGVQVTGASGNMGGSSRITIRGINSITGNNSPLFVVDGVVINNSDYNSLDAARGAGGYDYGNLAQDINPDDIASVSVLKGPNAAALYGSRGANGVILITTKKGSSAKKGIGVNVNSAVSFEDVFILPKYQNQYGGGYEVADDEGGVNGFMQQEINGKTYSIVDYATDESWGPRYNGQMVLHWNSFDEWDTENYLVPREWKAPENDVRDFFNTGVNFTNSVELSGGSEAATYRLAYTRMDMKGYMPNSTLDRNTVSVSGSSKLGNVVEAFTNISYVQNKALGRPSTGYDDNNIMQKFNQWGQRQLDMEEMKAYKNPDGTQRTWNRVAWDDATPNYSDNPYWTRYENYQNDTRNRVFGNVGANVKITDWLNLRTTFNGDYYNLREAERVAIGSQAQPKYYEGLREFLETNAEALLMFNKKIGEDFDIVGTLGVNRMDQHYSANLAQTQGGLALPDFFNLSNYVSGVSVTDYDRRKRINSVYGSANFGYRNTFFLEVTGRNDWSSALTPPDGSDAENSYFYPAVNASFVFSNLGGLDDQSWLTDGKIRAGWAQVGNDTDAYNNNLVYNVDLTDDFFPYTFGGIPLYGVANTKNNPLLKPETITSVEVGTQLNFFDRRLGIDFTYFDKKSTNLILPLQVSGATGVNRVFVNSGEMTNKGIELVLTGSPIRSEGGFNWDISVNFSRIRNEITKLYQDLQTYTLTNAPFVVTLNAMVGESYGSIRGTDFLYDQAGNKVVNANGRYRASDVKTIGNILPDWTGGITNTLTYKGIDFSFLIDVRQGGEFFSTTHMWGTYSGILERSAANNIREEGIVIDASTVLLDENAQPVFNDDGTVQVTGPNTQSISAVRWAADHYSGPAKQNVFDASYVKLREVRLGYTFPAKSTGMFRNLRLAAFGRNLAVWGSDATDFVDPENTTSSGNVQGIEGGALPSLRSYGFNISFGL
jgi:TonB-linked SusC/RagA family outer membrane protein